MHECYKTETVEGTAAPTGKPNALSAGRPASSLRTIRVNEPVRGGWVNVVAPTDEDRAWLSSELGVAPEFLRSAFDEDETSHIDYDEDENQVLVTLDYPSEEDLEDKSDPTVLQYTTHPISVIFLREPNILVTVSLKDNHVIRAFSESTVRGMDTRLRTRFLLQLLLVTSQRYLLYLRRIDRLSLKTEMRLHSAMRNEELIQMLGFQKSLVYFSTSLKGDEAVLTKIMNGRVIKLYDEDQDLLEDVLIEVRQAMEMCEIYSNIMSGTMDAVASVISNNLNIVMKVLTVITIVMAIPNIVFGFYGINVMLPGPNTWMVPMLVAIVGCAVATLVFKKRGMF